MSLKRHPRRVGAALASGLAACAITFASIYAAFWIPSDDDNPDYVTAAFVALLIAPLVLGPAYGLNLMIRQRRIASGLAVIVGVVLGLLIFAITIYGPGMDEGD